MGRVQGKSVAPAVAVVSLQVVAHPASPAGGSPTGHPVWPPSPPFVRDRRPALAVRIRDAAPAAIPHRTHDMRSRRGVDCFDYAGPSGPATALPSHSNAAQSTRVITGHNKTLLSSPLAAALQVGFTPRHYRFSAPPASRRNAPVQRREKPGSDGALRRQPPQHPTTLWQRRRHVDVPVPDTMPTVSPRQEVTRYPLGHKPARQGERQPRGRRRDRGQPQAPKRERSPRLGARGRERR